MATTYAPIATTTLSSAQSNVVFSSIPSTYTDLILIVTARDSRTELNDGFAVAFNADTSTGSTNYSDTYLGAGTSVFSGRNTNQRNITLHQVGGTLVSSNYFPTSIAHIMNYSSSDKNKVVLNRGGTVDELYAAVGLWRSNAAITTITLYPGYNGSGYTFAAGSTFTLFGIQAA